MTHRLTNAILANSIVVLLAVFILMSPYRMPLSSYVVALACVLSIVYRVLNKKTDSFGSPRWKTFAWLFVPMLAIFGLHLIGMCYTPLPKEGWKIIETYLAFLAFPAIFLLLGPDFFTSKRLKALAVTFCSLCLLIIVVYLTVFYRAVSTHLDLKMLYEQGQWIELFNAFLRDPFYFIGYNDYNKFLLLHHTIQAWCMLMAMSVVVYTWVVYPAWYKAWYVKTAAVLLLLLYAGVGVVMAASKMGWLMFGIWILLVLYFLWRRKCYGLAIGGIVLMLGMTTVLFVRMSTLSYIADKTYYTFKSRVIEQKSQEDVGWDDSVSPRLQMWKDAVSGIKSKPWFGWGTAGERMVITIHNGNPHNQWLLYGLRFGLLGILALAWLWWSGFRLAYLKRNYLLFLFLLLAFGFILTDRMLEFRPLCLFWGLFAVYAFNGEAAKPGTTSHLT